MREIERNRSEIRKSPEFRLPAFTSEHESGPTETQILYKRAFERDEVRAMAVLSAASRLEPDDLEARSDIIRYQLIRQQEIEDLAMIFSLTSDNHAHES